MCNLSNFIESQLSLTLPFSESEILNMDFLTPLMSIFDSSYSFIARRIGHIRHLNKRIQILVTKLEELKDTRDDLKGEVAQAELGGWTITKQVKGWLERVERTEAEIDDLLLAQPTRQAGMCVSSPTWSARYKLSKRALKKYTEITDLITNKATLDVLTRRDLQLVEPIPSKPTVGLNVALEAAIQYIADNEVRSLGIYGMGGVGKTSLLKEINNEYLSRPHDFEAVIWITVSKDFGLDRIQRALLSRLGLSCDETDSQEQLGSRIYSFMRRIKFLLLLDDLWQGLDLGNIGMPLPDERNKCKVVFTTRSMDVCSDMDANKKMKVDFLNEEYSWRLFCEKAGETNILNPHIEPYAEAIVKKCGGLPLALITAGRAMANKMTEEEWKYATEVLNNAPSEFRGMDDVFTVLQFSYDNLRDDTLKKCFLYCALFPEEYPLEKEQLIDYWVGEGFLDGSNDLSLHSKGHAIIGSLKVACLLEGGEADTQVKMHDVVRSFALWIASSRGKQKEKVMVQGCNGLLELPDIEKLKGAERISILDNEITMLSGVPVCPTLSTLLINWNCSLTKITNEFFQFMPVLKVLDLSVTSISEIPESIGRLVELRFLDLSRTKITALPRELGCLSKLRHMDLQRTHSLRTIPKEAILGLADLRILNMYYSFGEWETPLNEAESEITFLHLQHLIHLTALGVTVTENAVLKKLSGFENIHYLFIKGCEGLIYLMVASARGGGEKLRRLSIYNCCTLKEIDLGSEAGKDWLPSLEVLSLQSLANLTTIWRISVSSRCHRNLRYIKIWYCPQLKNVSWILHLPRLEKIYVFYCEEMEEIIGENDLTEGEPQLQFPALRTISFRGLPKLISISSVGVTSPVLQTIALIDCPQLKKLPPMGYDSANLPIVYCSRDWWVDLEWDNATSSSDFHPQFIAV